MSSLDGAVQGTPYLKGMSNGGDSQISEFDEELADSRTEDDSELWLSTDDQELFSPLKSPAYSLRKERREIRHKASVSDSNIELNPLVLQLNEFYDSRVRIGLDRKEICEDIAFTVIQKIIRKIQTVDSRFRANSIIPCGIPYDGLQAEEPIHFDMILQLSIGEHNTVYTAPDEHTGGLRLQPPPYSSQWEDCLTRSRFISASKVNAIFRRLVKKSVAVIQRQIKDRRRDKIPKKLSSLILEKGPSIKLTVNRDIFVDILPAFVIPVVSADSARFDCPSSSHAVCKEFKNEKGGEEMTWKMSFFVAEKNKIRALGSEGYRMQLLRILTEIRDTQEGLKKLSAYHLKNILFHEADEIHDPEEWSVENLSVRFMGLLTRLVKNLEDGYCPLYFRQPPEFKPENMFAGISQEDLDSMKSIVKNIKDNPDNFIKIEETGKRQSAWPWELDLLLPPGTE